MKMIKNENLRDFLRSYRSNSEDNVDNKLIPTLQKFTNWAAQIADNLAARNCLVHRNEIVEIGDFDMARYIYYHEYYQPTGKRSIPVRWMNQESLKDGKFPVKSDIWSYDNPKVFEYNVKPRKVLSGLEECADFWHHTMKHCWRYNPSDRPSFFQIFICLELHTTGNFKQQSFKHNEDEEKEEIEEVDNHDGKEDGRVDDDEEDDENENKNESDSVLSDHNFLKFKTVENHLEVIDEDDKSEDVILVLPKKRVRISTPDNNA
uniref:Insulin-like growth factor 1 receptor (inferred by orthology to a human protein) n=1 Tax=Strongyloides venezuelensis TaxID=75913 RepID=A0A0K0F4T4_STRVS